MVRWLLVILVIAALLWYFYPLEAPVPPKAEDSFIGGPVKALRKAEGFEKTYLDAAQEREQRMQHQLDEDSKD